MYRDQYWDFVSIRYELFKLGMKVLIVDSNQDQD